MPRVGAERVLAGQVHVKTIGAVRILWGLLFASIAIPTALLAVAAWHSRAQAFSDAQKTTDRMADTLRAQIENIFETYELITDRVADQVADLSTDEIRSSDKLHKRLSGMIGSYSQVGSIWIMDLDGAPINSSLHFPTDQTPVPAADYLAAFKAGERGAHVSSPSRGRTTGRTIIRFASPLLDAAGALRGAIVITAYPDYFRERFAKAAPELNYSAGIIRQDGAFLVRDAAVSSSVDSQRASSMFAKAIAAAPAGHFLGVSAVDNIQRMVSYRKLENYPVYVMFGLGTSSVLARWWEQMTLFGAFALAAMLGLGSTTSLALARTRRAQRAAQRLMEETQRRKQTEAKLITAQRMEALGQLTGGIAHDFNNLLTVVMGNLDMLRRAKEDRRPRLIDNGMHAVEQGRRLTQQLLAFGRRQNLRPETLDVNALIVGMSDMITQSLRGDIKLELDLAEKIWPVEIDPVQFQTALINLAVNARDAMPRGGKLVIRTANTNLGDGPGVAVSAADTGVGMPPEVLERAFEPFFTTKEIGRGTGLGLSQVVGFIDQSGGTVDIASEVDRGTKVTLLLPRAAGDIALQRERDVTPDYEKRQARILLVEDNAQVRELAMSILAEDGHDVVEASQADQALAILQSDPKIDFVFSDLVMPGTMDGLDLARAVRRRRPDMPIVLASGYSDAAAKVLAEGFVLVSKPYRPEVLTLTIRKALAERVVETESNVIPIAGRSADPRS